MSVDDGPHHENRLDDVGRAIDVRRAYDLHVAGCADIRNFGHQRGDILIYVGSQDSLDHEDVRPSLNRLDNPQIIDVSVLIEVEVGEHIGGVVD